MSHEEPPDPTEEELAEWEQRKAVANATTVRIDGLTVDAVRAIVEQAVESSLGNYHFLEDAREIMRKRIVHIVDEQVQSVGREAIESAVRQVIENGWEETNSYGEPSGRRRTVLSRLGELLEARDGYGSASELRVMKLAKQAIEDALRKEFKEEIECARKAFRAQVDELLKGKLVESLREAIGLK